MAAPLITIGASLIGMIILLFIFGYVRKKYKRFYMPKCYSHETWAPKERRGYFGWISMTLLYPEEKLLESAGIDAVLYLRSLKYCATLLAVISVLSVGVLVPVNRFAKGNHKDNGTSYNVSFDSFSIANVPQGSDLLWIHLISVFVFSLFTYFCIHRLYETLSAVEVENSQYKDDSIQNRTVMVTKLPNIYTQEEELKACFIEMFGAQKVTSATVVPQLGELQSLYQQKVKAKKAWVIACDTFSESRPQVRPQHKEGFLGLWGKKVDTIQYYERKIDALDKQIEKLKQQRFETTNTGFVTFSSVAAAMQCSQTLLHSNRNVLKSRLAPYPTDINWGWFSKPKFELKIRTIVTYALLAVLFLFWSIPVSAISAFANLQEFAKFEVLHFIVRLADRDPIIKSAIEGFLPSIGLSLFLCVLPFILKFIISIYYQMLNSQYDRTLLRFHWLFLTLNVFLVSVMTTTVLNLNQDLNLIDQPRHLVEMLALSLPSQALKLANYLSFEGFVGYPLFFFLRIDDLIICKIKQLFCTTRRQMREAEIPTPFDYPVQYAREFFIFTIAITYSSMTPFVVPFAALYLTLAYASAKYNFIFVLYPPYKGRKLTQLVVDRITFALFLYQITMMGIFTLKSFKFGGVIVLLAIYTVYFRWETKRKFFRSTKFLALRDCPKDSVPDTPELLQEIHDFYQPPALKSRPTELQQIPTLLITDDDEEPNRDIENGFEPPKQLPKPMSNLFRQSSSRLPVSVHRMIPLELEENGEMSPRSSTSDLLSVHSHIRSHSVDSDSDSLQMDTMHKPLLK